MKGSFRYCYNLVESSALVSHFKEIFDVNLSQVIRITERPLFSSLIRVDLERLTRRGYSGRDDLRVVRYTGISSYVR